MASGKFCTGFPIGRQTLTDSAGVAYNEMLGAQLTARPSSGTFPTSLHLVLADSRLWMRLPKQHLCLNL